MIRLFTALILALATLTGCGEVVVFGHVVRENPPKTEAAAPDATTAADASNPATEAAAPKPATEAATSVPATEATAAKPASEATAPKPATVAKSAHGTSATATTGLPQAHALHAVNVTLSPASQAGDASVDAAALLDAIRTELRSRNLLDEQNPSADGTAEVRIESAATHRTVNAVIFGRQPMAGTLTGELHVSRASGEELPVSTIVAESRWTVADDGQDKNALGPLYSRFATLAADQLTGSAANPNKDAGRQ
jgi:hypothetical protein